MNELKMCHECKHCTTPMWDSPCEHCGEDYSEFERRLNVDEVANEKIHPKHYNDTKITPFMVIDDWGLDFYIGTAVKYIKRAGKKSGESVKDDLEKAVDYLREELKRVGE